MSGRTIAIGDIHGCATALGTLLAQLGLSSADAVVTLGDYIDRGPDSRGVVDQLLELAGRVQLTPLIGNHEVMLLEERLHATNDGPPPAGEASPWLECGGRETLASYGRWEDIPAEHWAFYEGLLRHHETERHLFVHANYDPAAPLAEQPDWLLFWQHLTRFKPPPHCSGKTAVVGHTPQRSGRPRDLGHLIAIDTFCHGGGWLTALDVGSGEYWQANERGQARRAALRE